MMYWVIGTVLCIVSFYMADRAMQKMCVKQIESNWLYISVHAKAHGFMVFKSHENNKDYPQENRYIITMLDRKFHNRDSISAAAFLLGFKKSMNPANDPKNIFMSMHLECLRRGTAVKNREKRRGHDKD